MGRPAALGLAVESLLIHCEGNIHSMVPGPALEGLSVRWEGRAQVQAESDPWDAGQRVVGC